MKRVIDPGRDKYRARCARCACLFTYERNDVYHNYVKGGEYVSCPHCGHDIRFDGA